MDTKTTTKFKAAYYLQFFFSTCSQHQTRYSSAVDTRLRDSRNYDPAVDYDNRSQRSRSRPHHIVHSGSRQQHPEPIMIFDIDTKYTHSTASLVFIVIVIDQGRASIVRSVHNMIFKLCFLSVVSTVKQLVIVGGY